MSDYIKREDAKRAIRRNFHDLGTRCFINNVINEVAKVSSDNLVEVVRCKDCKYRHKEWHHDKRNKNGGYWISWCANDAIAERVYGLAFDYDYCSYGEETRHEV